MLVTLFVLGLFVLSFLFILGAIYFDGSMRSFVLLVPGALCGVVGFGMTLFLLIAFLNVKCIDNIPIKAYVDYKLVYKGVSACFQTETNGANTKVTVLGDPLCLKPINYYISKNVKIVK